MGAPLVVDVHCHAGSGDGLTGPWDTRAPLDAYLRRAAAAGIGHSILLPAFSSDYASANARLAAIVRSDPARFSGLAMIHPHRDAGHVRILLEEAVQRHGLRGVKVHRHDAPVTRELCEAAVALGLPLLYDVMGDVGAVELLAREFPQLCLVVPHLGSFGDDWKAQTALLPLLERHPNVYADTSGVRRFDVLAEAAQRAPGKLLFGSDGPWLHPGLELEKVRLLGLPPTPFAAVAGGTAARLFRLGRRARPGAAHAGRTRAAPPARPSAQDAAPRRALTARAGSVPEGDPWLAQEVAVE